jgi:5-methylcytosine-specific restriction endonuclease McrA
MDKEEYVEYLKSEDWQERRKEMMEEANWECYECGEKATQLHHLNYNNIGFELLYVDVVPLCNKCHKEVHHKEEDYEDYSEW